MAFCGNCGAQVEEGLKFCPGCGNEMAAPAVQQAEEVPVQAAEPVTAFDPADIEKNKIMAVLAYIIFLIPLLAAKDSPFAKFHTNQGLILFLAGIAVAILSVIPIIGWIIGIVAPIAITVLAVIGIIAAAKGEAKELPLIGKFKILK